MILEVGFVEKILNNKDFSSSILSKIIKHYIVWFPTLLLQIFMKGSRISALIKENPIQRLSTTETYILQYTDYHALWQGHSDYHFLLEELLHTVKLANVFAWWRCEVKWGKSWLQLATLYRTVFICLPGSDRWRDCLRPSGVFILCLASLFQTNSWEPKISSWGMTSFTYSRSNALIYPSELYCWEETKVFGEYD